MKAGLLLLMAEAEVCSWLELRTRLTAETIETEVYCYIETEVYSR